MPNLPHLKFLNLSVAQVFQLLRYKASQLCDKTSQLKTEELRVFSLGLVEYADKQWRQGVFATQDWNLFNINVMMVPATNNGNEVWLFFTDNVNAPPLEILKKIDFYLKKVPDHQRESLPPTDFI